jgi:rhodanese-related sulfurtransferase
MTTTQIVLYVSILLAVALYLRRWWLLRGLIRYSPREVSERLKQSGSSILLDVRTAGERSRNSIRGSIHIPLHELGKRVEELHKHKNKEIICYCQSGSRSMLAASRLTKSGFTVANMNGGIAEWNSSGLS